MPEVPFRDGPRNVPDHVAELLRGLETFRLTFEQAMIAANNRLLFRHIGEKQSDLIREHFRNITRGS